MTFDDYYNSAILEIQTIDAECRVKIHNDPLSKDTALLDLTNKLARLSEIYGQARQAYSKQIENCLSSMQDEKATIFKLKLETTKEKELLDIVEQKEKSIRQQSENLRSSLSFDKYEIELGEGRP